MYRQAIVNGMTHTLQKKQDIWDICAVSPSYKIEVFSLVKCK